MLRRKHRIPRMSDAEVDQRVADAVTRLTIRGEKVIVTSILAECDGASRTRFRRSIDRLLESGVLAERRRT